MRKCATCKHWGPNWSPSPTAYGTRHECHLIQSYANGIGHLGGPEVYAGKQGMDPYAFLTTPSDFGCTLHEDAE